MTRKTLTEVELAILCVTRDVCETAVRRGLAEVGLRVRLHESADRLKKMLVEFERDNV